MRLGSISDLDSVVQRPSETLRGFTLRFRHILSHIPDAPDMSVIRVFRLNVRDVRMLEKLGSRDVYTTSELYALADKCARMEEGRLSIPFPGGSERKTAGAT